MENPGSPAQELRALIAWLGLSERVAATELEVSQTCLRAILKGQIPPPYHCQERIEVMSRRGNRGLISRDMWPKDPPKLRGKGRSSKAKELLG